MLAYLLTWLRTLKREEGQDMAEYGLLIVLVALAVIVGAGLLGTNLDALFTRVAGELAP